MLSRSMPRVRGVGQGSRESNGQQDVQALLLKHHSARLYDAAMRGEVEITQEILAARADPNYADESGRLPLHAGAHSGCPEVVKLLLDARADANAAETCSNGGLALQIAAWSGYTEVTRLLLLRSACPNTADGRGWTPLVSAAEQGHVGTAQALLDRRADPAKASRPLRRGKAITPLMAAQEARQVRVGLLLRDHLDKRQVDANAPTSSAAKFGHRVAKCCSGVCSCRSLLKKASR
eukprot:TRINITY_DN30496_c0_g2_i2.p1 TRINITY_DN30496_c0_g2~~TRINITY_DN30496_c0_g2_i2.p1  ORF type:complete len:236 (+),score=39.79 TRINITY_DN30496_c0_g2_i2:215-922(+)